MVQEAMENSDEEHGHTDETDDADGFTAIGLQALAVVRKVDARRKTVEFIKENAEAKARTHKVDEGPAEIPRFQLKGRDRKIVDEHETKQHDTG